MRPAIVTVLAAAPWGLALVRDATPHEATHACFTLLFAFAPALVWFNVQPEPPPEPTVRSPGRGPLAVRFAFQPGGASGAAFFALALATSVASLAVFARVHHGAWFATDDPWQLLFSALYACVYVLLPVGLCTPLLQRRSGRWLAALACLAAPFALAFVLPHAPRGPRALTELGNPARMTAVVRRDGVLTAHAHDDVAALCVLAVLGIALHVPRIVRRWRTLAGTLNATRRSSSVHVRSSGTPVRSGPGSAQARRSTTMRRMTRTSWILATALFGTSSAVRAGGTNDAVVTFDAGAEGWSLNGWDVPDATGGNPGARLHWANFVDNFTMPARTSTHAAFVGDYTLKGPVALGIDWQVDFIQFFGSPVSRELVVILYDDDPFGGAPAGAVWTSLGTLDGNGMPWTAFETTVIDVHADELPPGWNGAGDEDPVTFEPILPAGRTWTNVLQGVDRVEFTTGVPGFFYGFTNFDVSIDNVRIEPLDASAFCFGADAACPCGNGGAPGAGCDNAQATGGVELEALPFAPNGMGGGSATLLGSGFSPAGSPAVVAIRSPSENVPPTVFGDGLLCIGATGVVRIGSTLASGGACSIPIGHGAGAGAFHYQLWYRNNPSAFCQPEAFNVSNGLRLVW